MRIIKVTLLLLCVVMVLLCSGCKRETTGTAVLSPQITFDTNQGTLEEENEDPGEEHVEDYIGVIVQDEQMIVEPEVMDEPSIAEDLAPEEVEIPPLDTASASNIVFEG